MMNRVLIQLAPLHRGAIDVAAIATTGLTLKFVADLAADTTRCTDQHYADFTALYVAKAAERLRAVARALAVSVGLARGVLRTSTRPT